MKTRGTFSRTLRCFLIAGAAMPAGIAHAAPDGGDVTHGDADIVHDGDVTTITTSDLAIINWQNFDIAGHETVRFIQPGASSRVLNKILGAGPTTIDGTLLANGQVYIVNPAGVVFGGGAVVNTGALFAAAATITDQDFIAGNDVFTDAHGTVENYGQISADLVAFVGGRVANHGTIVGDNAVVMAAGDKVMIGERFGSIYVQVEPVADPQPAAPGGPGPGMASGDMYSIAAYNTGTISGRQVHVEAAGGTARVEGTIDASGSTGGSVAVLGERVEIVNATIDASGVHGGGSVVLGGTGASDAGEFVVFGEDSGINVSALESGDAGSVIAWSTERTEAHGTITARGGEQGGNGGFVEVSSAGSVGLSASVDTRAVNGEMGMLLIDPRDIEIVASGGDDDANSTVINAGFLGDVLETTQVTLTTNGAGGTDVGNITVNPDALIEIGGGVSTALTMIAAGDIVFDGGVRLTGGSSLDLNLFAGVPDMPVGEVELATRATAGDGTVYLNNSLDLKGGALVAEGNRVLVADRSSSGRAVRLSAGSVDFLARDGGEIRVLGQLVTSGVIDGSGDVAVRLVGGEIRLGSQIRTDNNGGVQIDNAGLLTLDPASRLVLDGSFEQIGAGEVHLGADIFTSGDDIRFASDVYLTDDIVIRAYDNDVPEATPTIAFAGSIDSLAFSPVAGVASASSYFLSVDAGLGSVEFNGALGSTAALRSLRARGADVTVRGDVTTEFFQQYIAQTVTFDAADGETIALTSVDGARTSGLESAQIEVRADSLFGFAGNTVLMDDVVVTTAGIKGDDASFAGTVTSGDGLRRDLSIDAGNALAIFGGRVGGGAGDAANLGELTVSRAEEARFFGDIYTHGMTFGRVEDDEIIGVNVALNDAFTTVHTGEGVAWFGGHVYAGETPFFGDTDQTRGEFDGISVEFLYDGQPVAGVGEGRTPFKFTKAIGTRGFEVPRGGFFPDGAFASIRFGNDTGDNLEAASFLFASNARPGSSLTPVDEFSPIEVFAINAIEFGRGQKATSFGSLGLITTGGFVPEAGSAGTRIAFGDMNVLGDLFVSADTITLLGRAAGEIEGVETELDRDFEAIQDLAAEIIVAGDVELNGNVMFDAGPGGGGERFLGQGDTVAEVLFGDSITNLMALDSIDLSLFASLADGGLLYAYDLALTTFPSEPETVAENLGLGFNGEDEFETRYPDRYLPDREVLSELGMAPREMPLDVKLEEVRIGHEVHLDATAQSDVAIEPVATVVTRDRLSRDAVVVLTEEYVGLLGPRVDPEQVERTREQEVRSELGAIMAASGGQPVREWAGGSDAEAAALLSEIDSVLTTIQRLEIPSYERRRATDRFIQRITPAGFQPSEVREALLGPPADAIALN